mgnify:CR=1 FL=1
MEDNTKTNVTDINNGPTIIKTDNGVENGQNKCPKCGATDISPVASTGHLRCNFCHYDFEGEKFTAMMDNAWALYGKVIGSGSQDIASNATDIVTFKCSFANTIFYNRLNSCCSFYIQTYTCFGKVNNSFLNCWLYNIYNTFI